MLDERIFEPLDMSRTITSRHRSLENVAECHMALADGTSYQLPPPSTEDKKVMASAVAAQSNVHDFPKYYALTLHALRDRERSGTTSTTGFPLKQTLSMFRPRISLDLPLYSTSSRSYGMGWVRSELSGKLGGIGLNSDYIESMPTVGSI
jgi:CubicO group peptidase (beta-lactamase class C family)